jgi:hypothetical protein
MTILTEEDEHEKKTGKHLGSALPARIMLAPKYQFFGRQTGKSLLKIIDLNCIILN